MPKKDRFADEADTEPGARKPGVSGPAPKRKHSQSAPTDPPPPPSSRGKPPAGRPTARMPATRPKPSVKPSPRPTAKPGARTSGIKTRPGKHESDAPGAARIDEVTADLSRDPRRDKD